MVEELTRGRYPNVSAGPSWKYTIRKIGNSKTAPDGIMGITINKIVTAQFSGVQLACFVSGNGFFFEPVDDDNLKRLKSNRDRLKEVFGVIL